MSCSAAFTSTVPAALPSVFQSSLAGVVVVPWKKAVVPTTAMPEKPRPAPQPEPGETSFTITVPAAVPSVFHGSTPCVPSSPKKRRPPAKGWSTTRAKKLKPFWVKKGPLLGLTSFTRTVPAAVPSVFHSSRPTTPSLAAK